MQDRSRAYGLLICIGTVVAAIFFIWGIKNQSYWAVAIPVIIGFLTLLGLAFWIGWTIVTIKSDVTPLETTEPAPAEEPESMADRTSQEESSET
ncbi:MAG: hypothetical protein ACE5LX_05285 [Nitrospinota bacterium]